MALFDRGAARDLFDVRRILAIEGLDRGWIKAAVLALGACNRRDCRGVSKDAIGYDSREFRRNLAICLPRDLFRDAGDVDAWIAQSVELCREGLAFLFELSENERSFLDGVSRPWRGELESARRRARGRGAHRGHADACLEVQARSQASGSRAVREGW